MAQTATPDSQLQEDPSFTGEDATQGHKSFFGKLKDKTKVKTSKLKTKLKPGSKTSTGEDAVDEDSSSSSSDEEEGPAHNAVSGVTQPEFERRAEQAKSDHSQGLASEPAQSFPGNFAGIVDDRTESEPKEDEPSLSKGFEGLSTNDKDDQNESEFKPDQSTSSKDESSLSKGFEGLSTNDKDESAVENNSADELGDGKPVTQKIQETVNEGKEKVFPSGGAYEQTYASPDKSLVSEQAEPAVDSTTEAGKSWTQWAAEKVGYAKDTAAAKAPTTADGKPIHEAAYGAALGAKDTAVERAAASKDSLASSTASDPFQQSYVQKATGGIYGAKDKLFSSTEPGEHDKALSQKVTESVGNLPATLISSLGFGAKSGATSPTTTPALSEGSLPVSEESSDGAAQSPGLVSRITGLFSSKKPASETSTAPETTISETGAETESKVSESTNFS